MTDTLTDMIKRDLEEHLRTTVPFAAKLTLTDLARHYGVSLTPVRLAVRTLLEEQVLIKLPNGRLQVNPDTSSGLALNSEYDRPFVANSPVWEQALIEEIIARSLVGRSEYLRETAMARRLGIGRTVLRQAFNRLAGKGLLEHIPRCGWKVRTFDEADMRAYLTVREVFELTALDLAQPHIQEEDIERMLAGNTLGSTEGPPQLDNSLHQYLVDRSGNPYIRDFFDRHGLYYTALFDFAAPEAHVIVEMAAQHRAILAALYARNWTEAREALAVHIRSQHSTVIKLLMQVSGRTARSRVKEEDTEVAD